MLIDKEDAARRLNSPRNLVNTLPGRDTSVIVRPTNGRPPGTKTTPQSLRIIAGVLAKTEGVTAVAAELEIGPKVVSNAKNGKGSDEVASGVEAGVQRIRDAALDKLMLSLGIIDETTLSNCGAKDASIVARNLAGVVERLSPREQAGTNVQLVIYAPQQKREGHYEVLDVAVG